MTDITHYIYKISPTRMEMLAAGATPVEEEVIADHYSYLKGLHDQGVVTFAGRTINTEENTFGIVVLKADSEAAAHKIMNEDPAVAEGIMHAELYPFQVALDICR